MFFFVILNITLLYHEAMSAQVQCNAFSAGHYK